MVNSNKETEHVTIAIKALLVEDNTGDARLIQEELRDSASEQFDLSIADRLIDALNQLTAVQFDVVLLDLTLPDSQGFSTFTKVHAMAPDTPIVVVIGLNDDLVAVQAVRDGAQDYLMKGDVRGKMLVRAMRYAIERNRMERERERLISKLQAALAKIKTLSGLLPICASCKNIRDDKGYWAQIETYIQAHSDAEFSHGTCPDCFERLYSELVDEHIHFDSKAKTGV